MTRFDNASSQSGRSRLIAGGTAAALGAATLSGLGLSPSSAAAGPATSSAKSVANLAVASAPAASAAGLTVRVSTISQLRRAVVRANNRKGTDRIQLLRNVRFNPGRRASGPATEGDLDITDDLVIEGRGRTIGANNVDRVFDVTSGARLVLKRVTLTNGKPARNQSGGAVRNKGRLIVLKSTIIRNSVRGPGASGGAIANLGTGRVRLKDSLVQANAASADGGGVWNSTNGRFLIQRTRLLDNRAGGSDADNGGGAVYNNGGSLRLTNSRAIDNAATGAAGSGGAVFNNDGSLRVADTVLKRNTANRAGGAIEVNVGDTYVLDSDFLRNRTGTNPGNGGALHLTGAGNVRIESTNFRRNLASAEGGALWNSSTGTFELDSSTIDNNRANGNAADQGGGGLYNDGGELIVTKTSFRKNRAPGAAGSGGGILNNSGTVDLFATNFRGNIARRAGGGLETNAGEVSMEATDFLANGVGSAPGNGGAVHVTGAGRVTYDRGTTRNNVAANEGGAFWNSNTGTFTASDIGLAGNAAPTGPTSFNQGGGFGVMTVNGVLIAPGSGN
ncbi:hypothetical protein GCM10027020_34130 [Nocardioides salsibiostraticola]